MGIFGTSFQIGRSAVAAYQAAISVTGQNIANVGNPNYTRISGHLSSLYGGNVFGVRPGAGVRLSALERHIDECEDLEFALNRFRDPDAEWIEHEDVRKELGLD